MTGRARRQQRKRARLLASRLADEQWELAAHDAAMAFAFGYHPEEPR